MSDQLTEPLLALGLYALVTTITPGPNNLILAASGATFGFRRTLPNMMGILVGFTALVLLAGFAGEALLQAVPALAPGLRIAGVAYLLYLAWKIGTAGRPGSRAGATPLGFWQAVAFQFINPKGWAIALSAQAVFRIPVLGEVGSVLAVTAAFALISLPCCGLWVGFGSSLALWLRSERALRLVNGGLGLLTAASAGLMLV